MGSTRRNFLRNTGIAAIAGLGFGNIVKAENAEAKTHKLNFTKGMTFLFQGDSITDGNRSRDNDWNHLMGHGYAYLISSRLWFDYPEKELMFYNRGVSGNRVRDLQERWQKDTLDLKPDVISILVGVNDVIATIKNWDPEPHKKYEERFQNLLQRTLRELPKSKIILCEPFLLPLGWAEDNPEIWQAEIQKKQETAKKLASEFNTVYVELQDSFNEALKKAPDNYWIWDGVHPMPAGHELIARKWINVVGDTLLNSGN